MTSIGGDEPASRVVPAYFFEDGFDLRLPATFDVVLTAPAPLALQQKVHSPSPSLCDIIIWFSLYEILMKQFAFGFASTVEDVLL